MADHDGRARRQVRAARGDDARDGQRRGGLLRRRGFHLPRAGRAEALGDAARLVTADSETYPAAELSETRRLAAARHAARGRADPRAGPIRPTRRTLPTAATSARKSCSTASSRSRGRAGRRSCTAPSWTTSAITGRAWRRRRPRACARRSSRPSCGRRRSARSSRSSTCPPGTSRPSPACRPASSTATGSRPDKLRQIDAAETFVRSLGFRHSASATTTASPAWSCRGTRWPRLWEDGRHEAIVKRLRELGYQYVTLDLQGFRSGSANEALRWIAKK